MGAEIAMLVLLAEKSKSKDLLQHVLSAAARSLVDKVQGLQTLTSFHFSVSSTF